MKKVDSIIIPKKVNSQQLKYFRNIRIYKADWNAIISVKWKEALKSEDCHMIQPNQFGSRKQKSTMHPFQLEISQLEISRLSRQQYGHTTRGHATIKFYQTLQKWQVGSMEYPKH
jgi:hypothetical protein